MAWAFGKADLSCPLLFAALARAAELRMGEFNEQGLANTAWAFAKVNLPFPLLFAVLARVAERSTTAGTNYLAAGSHKLHNKDSFDLQDCCAHNGNIKVW